MYLKFPFQTTSRKNHRAANCVFGLGDIWARDKVRVHGEWREVLFEYIEILQGK